MYTEAQFWTAVYHLGFGFPKKWVVRETGYPLYRVQQLANCMFPHADEYPHPQNERISAEAYDSVLDWSLWGRKRYTEDVWVRLRHLGKATMRGYRKGIERGAPRIADAEYVIELAKTPKPWDLIVRETGLETAFVRSVLTLTGFTGVLLARKMNAELYTKIDTALEDGWSFGEVVRTFGVAYPILSLWFPGRGWTPGGKEITLYRRGQRVLDEAGGLYASGR